MRKVECVDTGEVFESIKAAVRHTGKQESHFMSNLKNGWRTGGKLYRLYKEENV